MTRYLVRCWRVHTSADDEWLWLEELVSHQEKVAEYDAAAPRRRAALQPDAAPMPAPAARPAAACGTRRVSAPGSVRGRDGPGPCRPIGAVLLADRRLGSWDGGAA